MCAFISLNKFLQLLITFWLCSDFGTYCQHEICPNQCVCHNPSEAYCPLNGKNVTSILQNLPIGVKILTIMGGNIKELKSSDFSRYRKLEEVKLYTNNISRILPYTFVNLTNLRKIYIEKNQLTELEPYSFGGLENIEEIFLTRNKITRLRKFVFGGSKNLKNIDLRWNPLEIIESYSFSNLNTVGTLHLPSNISKIEEAAFENLTKLSFVEFPHLDLPYLGPEIFKNMGPVQSMLIRDCNLGLIKSHTFSQLAPGGIRALSINRCKIKRIRRQSFENATIHQLEFNGNVIERLENGALESIKSKSFNKNQINCERCENVYWIVNKDVSSLIESTLCFEQLRDHEDQVSVFQLRSELMEKCDASSLIVEDYDENIENIAVTNSFFNRLLLSCFVSFYLVLDFA